MPESTPSTPAPARHLVFLVTVPDEATGQRLARALVEERVVACVNLVPGLTSIYRWQGAIEQASEYALVMKTTAGRAELLQDRVRALHPYDTPECVGIPIVTGLPRYLAWIEDSVEEDPR